jgi:hypothetical protein
LPYQASTTLHLKLPYPITNFGVMHPPSMSFKALRPDAFRSPGVTGGLRVEQAVTTPLIVDVPAFEISGLGKAPERAARTSALLPDVSAASGNPHAPPIPSPPAAVDRSGKELWLMMAEAIAMLAVGVVPMWWKRRRPRDS